MSGGRPQDKVCVDPRKGLGRSRVQAVQGACSLALRVAIARANTQTSLCVPSDRCCCEVTRYRTHWWQRAFMCCILRKVSAQHRVVLGGGGVSGHNVPTTHDRLSCSLDGAPLGTAHELQPDILPVKRCTEGLSACPLHDVAWRRASKDTSP